MENIKEVGKKYLSGEDKYSYCPYCVKKAENEGKKYKDFLKPLIVVTYSVYMKTPDGQGKLFYEDKYRCPNCNSDRITVDTFRLFYTCRSDGTKWNERPIEPGSIWSIEKNCFVPAKWDDVNFKWVEIENQNLKQVV